MKAIYITAENKAAITAAIADAEGKATARTMSFDDLQDLVAELEQNPAIALLPKSKRTGITASLQEAHSLPNAYRHRAEATCASVAWGPKGWKLTKVKRIANRNAESNLIAVEMPEKAASEAHKRFQALFITKA